jgi:uroporphyrinogen decarboxylase
LIKPRQAQFYEAIHQQTNARLFYHTCGSVYQLIDDFIEIGVDILNPIQVGAYGMDTAKLGEKYAGRLTCWGAVDNQKIISQGTSQGVTNEVQLRIHDLATPRGGYVISASHNIQPDTIIENILALAGASRIFSSRSI